MNDELFHIWKRDINLLFPDWLVLFPVWRPSCPLWLWSPSPWTGPGSSSASTSHRWMNRINGRFENNQVCVFVWLIVLSIDRVKSVQRTIPHIENHLFPWFFEFFSWVWKAYHGENKNQSFIRFFLRLDPTTWGDLDTPDHLPRLLFPFNPGLYEIPSPLAGCCSGKLTVLEKVIN